MLDEPKGIGTIRQAIIESVKDGDMSKIPPWKPAQDNVANSAQEKDFHLETLTAPSVPALFATRPDGPFIREPAPISRTPIPPTKPEFSSALEDKLVLEEDPYTRLDLARTLIVVQPTNRTAAQVLVGGAISSNADLRDKSRRFLAEVLPSAPDSLVEELLKTMQQADEFTRADLADWLALIDPEGRMHSRPEKERH
jgi:hypothetical protein